VGGSYLGSAGSVLGSTSSDVGDLVVLLQVGVATRVGSRVSTAPVSIRAATHISDWLPSARTASLALRLYFWRRDSPLTTCMSRRGFPMATRIGDMVLVWSGSGRWGGVGGGEGRSRKEA
jgi:hypothetical protein